MDSLSPCLIRPPSLPSNCDHIMEVAFGERENYLHLQQQWHRCVAKLDGGFCSEWPLREGILYILAVCGVIIYTRSRDIGDTCLYLYIKRSLNIFTEVFKRSIQECLHNNSFLIFNDFKQTKLITLFSEISFSKDESPMTSFFFLPFSFFFLFKYFLNYLYFTNVDRFFRL